MVEAGAFPKVAFKLLSDQQQKLNEMLNRQMNSSPDGAAYWRLILAHENAGPYNLIKKDLQEKQAEELSRTIGEYCATSGTRQGCALRRSQGFGMLNASNVRTAKNLTKTPDKLSWKDASEYMQGIVERLIQFMPFQDTEGNDLWLDGMKISTSLADAGPRVAQKNGPGMCHRLKTKEDCLELMLREVARLLEA